MSDDSTSFDPKTYWEDRLKRHAGIEGVGFLRLGLPYNKWLYRFRRNVFQNIVSRLNVDIRTSRVLDIGSGTGFYLELWKENQAEQVIGSDLTEVAVQRLQQQFADMRIMQMDITNPELPSDLGDFDIISMFDVLFHIVDDNKLRQALTNIHSLLKPDGVFVFSDNFVHRETQTMQHVVHRSLGEYESMLADVGFEIVERKPMFILMNYPCDAGKLFQSAWKASMLPIVICKPLGGLIGALMYPLEKALVGLCNESPTTEYMICRKRVAPGT